MNISPVVDKEEKENLKNDNHRSSANHAIYMVSDLDIEHSVADECKIWTLDMAKFLSILSYKCAKMFWVHDQDAQHFHHKDKLLTATSSLASVCSSLTVTAIMGFFDTNSVAFYILTSATIALNLLVTLINTWRYIFNYTIRVLEHNDKANKYIRLHRKISCQFALPLEERYSAKTLMDYTSERMAELEREQPFNRGVTISRWSIDRINFFYDSFVMPEELRQSSDMDNLIDNLKLS